MKKFLFAGGLLACFMMLQAQTFKYTRSHIDITNNSDFSSFFLMDSAIKNYHVFFSGENHQFKATNARLELKLLKYLDQKAGVKHLLLEFSYTTGYLLEQYMFENDTTAYNILKANYHDQYMWMFERLKEYNATLDSNQKIRIHGIDFEDDMQIAVRTLVKLMPAEEAPDSIGLHIETLRAMNGRYSRGDGEDERYGFTTTDLGTGIFGYSYRSGRTISEMLNNYERQKPLYEAYFGKHAKLVNEIMWHLKQNLQWREYYTNGSMQERPFRERYMYNNFLKLVEQYPGAKFFGQFGRCHTSLNETDENCDITFFNSLAGKINNSSNTYLNGKVFIVAGFYPRAEYSSSTSNIHTAGFSSFLTKMEKQAFDTAITLFLVEKDSAHYGDLYKHYNFIFFNNNTLSEDFALKRLDRAKKKRHSGFFGHSADLSSFIGFSYQYQLLGVKTSSLKPFFGAFGFKPPASPLVMRGGAFIVLDDFSGDYFNGSYMKMNEVLNKTSDTSEFSFGAASVSMKYGTDIFPDNPLINLIPCFGFTYAEMKIKHTITKTPQLFQSEQAPSEVIYKNPAFCGDVSLHFSTHFYCIGLSGYGGYQFDVSGQKWRKEGNYSDIAPKTSMNGWYAGASIGLFIFY